MRVSTGARERGDVRGAREHWLVRQHPVVRTLVVWAVMMVVLWVVFAVAVVTHPAAWTDVTAQPLDRGWPLLWLALGANGFILAAIAVGNLFVRFGGLATPGLLVLVMQAVVIGWTAGTNAFAAPFQSVAAANAAFLRVGLWETTAYAVMCAVTLRMSRLVADGFPAREWVQRRSLRQLWVSGVEWALVATSVVLLTGAAVIEAFGS